MLATRLYIIMPVIFVFNKLTLMIMKVALIMIDVFWMCYFLKFLFRKVVNAQCLKKLRFYIGGRQKL